MRAEREDALGSLFLDSGTASRRVRVVDYLDGPAEESAAASAHAWIKAVRSARIEGTPLRRRFLYRGDSLWWFAELYLHKRRVILNLHRALTALDRIISAERPVTIRMSGPNPILNVIGPQVARARNIGWTGARQRGWWTRLVTMDARSGALMLGSRVSRLRRRQVETRQSGTLPIAAFVHNAFWRRESRDGSPESYIGPVLEALEAEDTVALNYVGVGPASNFRARRWWHPLKAAAATRVTSIEAFAGPGAMKDSSRLWSSRHAMRRALWKSEDLRRHAQIAGCDCWTIVRHELAGVALLQWPWSARAMDEAGAALDALRPAAALTYAEAGGWGRAVVLECRRRGIRSVGLQHGFIYRDWLNYRHEADEMGPDAEHPADTGFPRPDLTLLFDEFTRRHLESAGHFPPQSLEVTGSPRLDAVTRTAAVLTPEQVHRARADAGAGGERMLALVVTKYTEAARVLPALVEAVRTMPDVQLAIKTHPAETPTAYAAVASAAPNVRVLPSNAPLAPLLRASRAVVTVNSTVAIDATVLGVPALVIGLPTNLSPFVDAGFMAGAHSDEPLGPALRRILYDEGFRQQLERDRGASLTRFGIGSDGLAAARCAAAILGLTASRKGPRTDADPT